MEVSERIHDSRSSCRQRSKWEESGVHERETRPSEKVWSKASRVIARRRFQERVGPLKLA